MIVETYFNIIGRGKVFVIDLEKNNLPTLRKDLNLIGKEITIENKQYLVTGVELQGLGEKAIHRSSWIINKTIIMNKFKTVYKQ
jgi:hypothetical protein